MNTAFALTSYARAAEDAREQERVIDGLTRRELIEKYAPKVRFLAKRIAYRLPPHAQIELGDLLNTGALGLLDAIDRFEPARNVAFGTYAEFRIRGAMLDLLRGLDPMSRTAREKANLVQATLRELEQELGRPPESEEVAARLQMSVAEYQSLLHEVRGVQLVSLDAPRGPDGDGASLGESIEDVSLERPDQALDRKDAIRELAGALETALPERLRLVLVLYYHREMSLKEIGATLGVTESRVCQLHTEACLRLHAKLSDSLRPGEGPKQKTRKTRRG